MSDYGYYNIKNRHLDDEFTKLDRLGIHQEKRTANGDSSTRAYVNSLERSPNYYVPPASNHIGNGIAGPYTTSTTYPKKPAQNSDSSGKVGEAFRKLVCCIREPVVARSSRKDFFVLPPTPKRPSKSTRRRTSVPRQSLKTYANGVGPPAERRHTSNSKQGSLLSRKWFQHPRESHGASLRPSKISRGHPSPILGVPSPKVDKPLLPPPQGSDAGKNCLIVDLDETLVHSSFKPIENPNYIVPVEIDGTMHNVYVIKRPFVDEFLQRIGEWFECVLFTASLAKYADPVANLLDRKGIFRTRLFREACVTRKGSYIKDLNRLGRDLTRVIILDNSPASYAYHPDNAIPVQSWFDDSQDTELIDLLPFLDKLSRVDNVYTLLKRTKDQMGTKKSGTRRKAR